MLTRARLIRIVSESGLVLAGSLVCLWLSGYLDIDVNVPAKLAGDHLFQVTMAKSFIDGHGFRLNPNLGFPEVQDYLYFPVFETTQRALLWLTAIITQSPFKAIHGYYIAGIALMYAATVWALRWLGVRWWFAGVAAVGYVVSPFMVGRAFGHDLLALYYAAPFGMALALRIGAMPAPESLRGFFRQPFVVVAVLVAAASGIYYGFFSLMFVAFSAVAAAVSQRRLRPLTAGLVLCGAMLVVLVISGFGLDIFKAMSGRYATPTRAPYEEVLYGLDLPSMALQLQVTAHAKQAVADTMRILPGTFGMGEFPGFLLTLVLALTPLIAASAPFSIARGERDGGAADAVAQGRVRLIGFAAILATFGLLYADRGGLGFLFNIFVSPQIRGTSRIMPFLSFAALVVVALGAELAADARPVWLRTAVPALLAGLLLASILPIRGSLAATQMRHYVDPVQKALRASTPPMLIAKDRIGAQRVLQLPLMYWPESPVPRPDVDPYASQLPYVYDRRRSTTRWSYGSTPAQKGILLRMFVLKDPEGLPARARAYGYDSILLEKQALGPDTAKVQTSIERQLGAPCLAYDDAVYALYSLAGACGGGE